MGTRRLDQLLVDRALCESREKAQRLIRTGRVLVAGHPSTKPGHSFAEDIEITITETDRFVSRGGEKMLGGIKAFNPSITGTVGVDVGASTGGFTDCLLQHGASKIYAVDVGKGQLHWKLRNDERVVVLEKLNARTLPPDLFTDPLQFAVVDVSFISLTKILPALSKVLDREAWLITLIKPQFEAGREKVGKGGVVTDPAVHEEVIEKVKLFGTTECGLAWEGLTTSPLKGPAGNVEFLAYWMFDSEAT